MYAKMNLINQLFIAVNIFFITFPIFKCVGYSIKETNDFKVHICKNKQIITVSEKNFYDSDENSVTCTEKLQKSNYSSKTAETDDSFNANITRNQSQTVGMNAKKRKISQSQIFESGISINKNSSFLKSLLVGINETIKQFTYIGSNPKFFEKDCMFVNIIEFSNYGIVFRAYAPQNFVHFRVLYNVARDYDSSFQNSTLKKIKNPEKSGSMFFFTDDSKFIIKTLYAQEVKLLRSMLSDYFSHFCEYPNTLLPNISGLYYLKYKYKSYYFIVMSNIYPYDLKYGINQKYDLKGVSRRADEDFNRKDEKTFRLLDEDFVDNYPGGLILPHNIYTDLKMIQNNDCELLKRFNIMDYSLLIVVEPFKQRMTENNTDINDSYHTNYKRGIRATTYYDHKDLLIYIGIIDILQTYTFRRKIETVVVGILPSIGMSFEGCIVDPDYYMERYLKFITNKVFKSEGEGKVGNTYILQNM